MILTLGSIWTILIYKGDKGKNTLLISYFRIGKSFKQFYHEEIRVLDKTFKEYISEKEISVRLDAIAEKINNDFAGKE